MRSVNLRKLREIFNVDNIIDLLVDLFLLLFDVITSPVLIIMRLVRWTIGKFFLDGLKNKIKNLVHWLKNKPTWIKLLVIPLLLIITAYILVFMWIIGQAFGEFIMEEWGNEK